MKQQQASPIDTPGGCQIVDVSGMPLLASYFIIMRGKKMTGTVGRRLRVGEIDPGPCR
jgi:hypothetical protein